MGLGLRDVPPALAQSISGPRFELQTNDRERVIVFVHGFTGNSTRSWTAANGASFPSLLATDPQIKHADVFVASYETHWTKDRSTIASLGDELYKQLSQAQLLARYKDIVFICHSLGGLVVERAIVSHSDLADHTAFIQFFGTPHEGAFSEVSNPMNEFLAAFGDNSLIPELRAGSGNQVLVKLDSDWRAAHLDHIRRFCAVEAYNTTESITHTFNGKVVDYFSGAAGCDTDVPVDTVYADHSSMVKVSARTGEHNEAYLIFVRNYRMTPYRQTTTYADIHRDYSQYLQVDCEHTNSNPGLAIAFALNADLKEELVSASAELVNRDHIKDVNPDPPGVTKTGTATVSVRYGFNGVDKSWGNCPGGGHATLVVRPTIRAQVPIHDGE